MADADDFDIDIYGDDRPEELVPEPADQPPVESRRDTATAGVQDYNDHDTAPIEPETEPGLDGAANDAMIKDEEHRESHDKKQTIAPTAGQVGLATMGDDYQDDSSYREADPDALPALKLIEVQWWTTEDDIRGWANAAHAEAELIEITFNEHKVNGKSKGEVFVEFQTPEAATAVKHQIDSVVNQAPGKKISVSYAHPSPNPYKSLPKDAQNRNKDGYKDKPQGNYNGGYNNQNSFRGGRGGYNRGGYQNRGGYNQNNNQMGMMSGFGGMNNMGAMGMGMGAMGGFGGQMGFNRGGNMMGMNRGGFPGGRGGRGGMMGGMMPNMGMGGMGGMGMDMGMGIGFGGGFQQGGYINNQFGGNSPPSNPHGAKRPRAE
ncbi:hypothetical protein BDZ85DRAFT_284763 [Elsinoe ampelina]|uniref:RRM domain-containing protein n=1 Tax=Elsinoe ampelina TaxID=302913 RepID=A0A6A6G425_9PEZI|nr:hypothetical protein BDZ85DRAFT_284763 [Elsinoe ampelina]